jgi:hypothetical protein
MLMGDRTASPTARITVAANPAAISRATLLPDPLSRGRCALADFTAERPRYSTAQVGDSDPRGVQDAS